MALSDPLPSLDEILESFGVGGQRLATLDATEGAAGNISVAAIAKRLGVSRYTFYQYFPQARARSQVAVPKA